MPLADLVICHGGHGTIARALSCGKPLVVVPAAGDMAENATRVAWSGAGLALPMRFSGATTIRWAVQRVLENPSFAARARELGAWSEIARRRRRRRRQLIEGLAAARRLSRRRSSAASASSRS